MSETNKQKCLKMWRWLTENDQCEKVDYLRSINDMHTFYNHMGCYACKEVGIDSCSTCPIKWDHNGGGCYEFGSAYMNWCYCQSWDKQKYALEMVKLIEDTWKE